MDTKKIGEFLKSLRKAKGLTQQAVADELYVNSKTISKWENGDSIPDISIISNVAKFYGVTVDEILRGHRNDDYLLEEEKNELRDERLVANVIRRKYNIYFYISLGVLMTFFLISLIVYGCGQHIISMILHLLGLTLSLFTIILGNQICYYEVDDYEDRIIEKGIDKSKNKINLNNKLFSDVFFTILMVFINLYIIFSEPNLIKFSFANYNYFNNLIIFEMLFGSIIILGYYLWIRNYLFKKLSIEQGKTSIGVLMLISSVFIILFLIRQVEISYLSYSIISGYTIKTGFMMWLEYFPEWLIIMSIEILFIIGSIISIIKKKVIPVFVNLMIILIVTIIFNLMDMGDYQIVSLMSIIILTCSIVSFVFFIVTNNKNKIE